MSAFYDKVLNLRESSRPLIKAKPVEKVKTPVKKPVKKAKKETAVIENDSATDREAESRNITD